MKPRMIPVWLVALVTLGSGIVNLISVMHFPGRRMISGVFAEVFPLEFFHLSRFLTLLIGFALVISSVNILKRKRRAFVGALLLTSIAIPFHLAQSSDYRGAIFSTLLLVVLLLTRRNFTVRSEIPNLDAALLRLAIAVMVAFAYGIFGFWVLDKRQFGINFTIPDAIHRTLLFLTLVGDDTVIPRTRYAQWFIDSLYLMTVATVIYSFYSLFRPVLYRFRTQPRERALAAEIVARHGRSTLDFFKYWPDKSFFFSPTQESFIAYRVGGKHAIALGDPVGPEPEIEEAIRLFKSFCSENDWSLAFHQVLPDHLPVYGRLGFRKLKIGDDAIVDLASFTLEGRVRRDVRSAVQKLEKMQICARYHEPPIPDRLMEELKGVSDEWLALPGRRERGFTLGQFDPAYVRGTPVFVVADAGGGVLGFVNLMPSFVPGEATIDLMRRRTEAPNGIMDYLLVRLLFELKERRFTRFNLGMAPMSGFQEREEATSEERAIHYFFQHLTFLFSYRGLRAYKAKFASGWEPRYLIFQTPLDLPRIAIALGQVSEVVGRPRRRGGDDLG